MQQTLKLDAKMSKEHLDVLNIIKNCKDEAITRKQIVAILGKDASYFRQLNDIITDLVVIFNEPIGSSSNKYKNGYFYCRTKNDFRIARQSLNSRVDKIMERERVLMNLSNNNKK